jgi:hypothetical protein
LSIITPVNSATIVGPLTNAYESAVITTKSPMPSNSAGPDTAGPSTIMMIGTTPEQSVSALAAKPHPCSAENPSTMSAPLDRMIATSGNPLVRAVLAAFSSLPDESDVSAPTRDPASTSTHTTCRPSKSRTSALTAPTTRWRSATDCMSRETR